MPCVPASPITNTPWLPAWAITDVGNHITVLHSTGSNATPPLWCQWLPSLHPIYVPPLLYQFIKLGERFGRAFVHFFEWLICVFLGFLHWCGTMNTFVSQGWLIWDILVVYRCFDCVRSHNSLFFFASEQLRIFAHLKKLVKMMRPSDSLKLVRDGSFPGLPRQVWEWDWPYFVPHSQASLAKSGSETDHILCLIPRPPSPSLGVRLTIFSVSFPGLPHQVWEWDRPYFVPHSQASSLSLGMRLMIMFQHNLINVGHVVYFMGDLILRMLWCCCHLQDILY